MATKLEKLLVGEVSGVDRPANMLDGWMVAKAVSAEQTWDVAEAEARIRKETGATHAPNEAYASCFLWYDDEAQKSADGVPASFGDYKFLVCDVVDGEVLLMPTALRAAAERLPESSLPDADKKSVGVALDQLLAKAGLAEDDATSKDAAGTPSIAERVISLFRKTEEIDMTSEELEKALDERDEKLILAVAEIVKSVEPTPSEGAETASTEETPATKSEEAPEVDETKETEQTEVEPVADGLTIEDVQKGIAEGIAEALAPYNDILEKVLDRLESAERALGIAARKSIEGQEDGASHEEATPTLKDAIGTAFRVGAGR